MTVIIDNGHGENTKGKRSPKGMLIDDPEGTALYEFEFNRDIAERLIRMLDKSGIDFYELVPEIHDVSLSDRVARVNQLVSNNKDVDYFLVSIHANAGGGTGWEVFTSVGQTESDVIAEVFFQEAKKAFPNVRMRSDNTDGDSDKEAQFYILRKTVCPAILTENFFMDHEKDLELLLSDEGREMIAKLHHDAIKKYIESKG